MKTYILFIAVLITTVVLGIAACVSTAKPTKLAASALPECTNVVKVFGQSKTESEVPQVKSLEDGGAIVMLIEPAQKSVRGLVISSPHTRLQVMKNNAGLKAEGQCQAEGLVFEVSAFEVPATPPKDPT